MSIFDKLASWLERREISELRHEIKVVRNEFHLANKERHYAEQQVKGKTEWINRCMRAEARIAALNGDYDYLNKPK